YRLRHPHEFFVHRANDFERAEVGPRRDAHSSVSGLCRLLHIFRVDLEWANAGQALVEVASDSRGWAADHILGSVSAKSASCARYVSGGIVFDRIDRRVLFDARSAYWRYGWGHGRRS